MKHCRIWTMLALALILAIALALRYQGSKWPNLHPDNAKMIRWMKHTSTRLYIQDQVYPGGFFFFFRPVQWLSLGLLHDQDNVELDGRTLTRTELDWRLIILARHFNAWIGALNCALMFALAYRVFRSHIAALAAAAFLALFRFHVEHSHYMETDVLKLFTLTLALLAWVWLAEKYKRRRLLLASFLSGVAAGVKFPLTILITLTLGYSAALPRHNTWRKHLPKLALLTAAGLATFLFGLALMNPAMLLKPRWFIGRLAADAAGTVSEKTGVIGESAGLPLAGLAHQLLWLGRYLCAWGWPALLATACGAWLWLRNPDTRSRGLPIWIFTMLFAIYLIGAAPWIRMQETFSFLVLAACSIGALAASVFSAKLSIYARAGRWVAAALVLATMAWGAQQSAWISSVFAWQDTRFMAETWLQRRWPSNASLGLEIYTKTIPIPNLPTPNAHGLYKVEHHNPATSHLNQCAFVLRNETMNGRGLINPFTGRLYDSACQNLAHFHENRTRLRGWTPSPANNPVNFAFVSPHLVLYGQRQAADAVEASIPLMRPWHILGEQITYFKQGHELGAAEAVPVHRWGVTVGVGGPDQKLGPVYAVVFSRGEPAHIKVRGFGKSHIISLAAWDAYAVRLDRAINLPRLTGFEQVTAKLVTGQRRLETLPCLTLAFSPDEALATILTMGRRTRALDFMDHEGMNRAALDEYDQTHKQPCLGQARLKITHQTLNRWFASIAQSTSMALNAQPEAVKINGLPETHYNAFARINSFANDELHIVVNPNPGPVLIETPVLLPPGTWHLSCEWRAEQLADTPLDGPTQIWVETPDAQALWQGSVPLSDTGAWQTSEANLTLDTLTNLNLKIGSSAPVRLIARHLCVSWTLRERLAANRNIP